MANMYGLDVSHWQMDSGLDTSTISADFIICKATQGTTYKDDTMDAALNGAINSGKLVGVYHFANGKSSGAAEANYFVSVIKSYIGKALLILDWEGEALEKGPEYALEFCDTVYNLTKVKPIIYGSTSNMPGDWTKFAKKYPNYWSARYGENKVITGYADEIPHENDIGDLPFKEIIRQYSSNTIMPGFNGKLDANKAYITKKKWQNLCKPVEPKTTKKKLTVEEVANKIISGTDGWNVTGNDRVEKLKSEGYDPVEVQNKINEILKANTKPVKDTNIYYTVKKGDTFSGIARKYGYSILGLKKINPQIKNVNTIHIGDKIRVK